MMYAKNIVIIIKNFRFFRADHKAGIACERHTREMEKSPLSTQCAGIKSSRPDAHMCGDRGFESRPLPTVPLAPTRTPAENRGFST